MAADDPRPAGRERRTLDELFDFLPADTPDDDLGSIEIEIEAADGTSVRRRRAAPAPERADARSGADEDDDAVSGERLQKVLSRSGFGSRRVCEDLIGQRRVRVNGEVAVLGRRVDAEHDRITVDGAPVGTQAGLVYYLLNKPRGVITTADDPQGRPTVVALVPAQPRVHPVGRLDADTEGLLLLTNDGELTHRLTHPSFGVEKEYLAEVVGSPSPQALRRLREGVELEDGLTAPAQASLVAPGMVRITIHEGRNRQVRRMLDAVGHPVVRLVRTRIDRLADRSLRPGTWRPLTPKEVRGLSLAVRGEVARPSARSDDLS